MNGKRSRVGVLLLLIILLLGLAPAAAAQEVVDPVPACVPLAARLAEEMDVECEEIMAWHAEGAGYGQVKMAWRIAQLAPEDSDVTWEDLLEGHLAGEGWGERLVAYRLGASLMLDPEMLLDLKRESDLGWGQIAHAAALAIAWDMPVEQAAAYFADGAGWSELREELGLPPGGPPWSNGRGNRVGPDDEDLIDVDIDDVESDEEDVDDDDKPVKDKGTRGRPENPGAQGRGRNK